VVSYDTMARTTAARTTTPATKPVPPTHQPGDIQTPAVGADDLNAVIEAGKVRDDAAILRARVASGEMPADLAEDLLASVPFVERMMAGEVWFDEAAPVVGRKDKANPKFPLNERARRLMDAIVDGVFAVRPHAVSLLRSSMYPWAFLLVFQVDMSLRYIAFNEEKSRTDKAISDLMALQNAVTESSDYLAKLGYSDNVQSIIQDIVLRFANDVYNTRMTNAILEIDALARSLNLPDGRKEELQKMILDFAAGAKMTTATPVPPAPNVVAESNAPALAWPTAKWKDAPEKILGKKRGIVTFLKREWEPFIKASGRVVTRDDLALHDADAEQAFSRHLDTHEFPAGISIVYPKHLAKAVAKRPDLVRAALGG